MKITPLVMKESSLLTSNLNKYDEITTFNGLYNCYVYGNDFHISYPASNSLNKTSNDVLIISAPTFRYFKETTLGAAKHIRRSPTNVVTVGDYEQGYLEDINDLRLPLPTKEYSLLFSQYKDFFDKTFREVKNKPNFLFFDIETVSLKDKVKINMEKYPILAIGYALNNRDPRIIEIQHFDETGTDFKTIVDPVDCPEILLAEKKMLEYFFDVIEKSETDVIVGYNSIGFDMSYIMKRAIIHKLEYSTISKLFRHSSLIKDEYKTIMNRCHKIAGAFTKISLKECTNYLGRNHIDIYKMWYKMDDSMKGVSVASGLIESKLDLDASKMWVEYTTNYDMFIKYLFLDIELTRELFLINFNMMKQDLESVNCGITVLCQKTTSTIPDIIFTDMLMNSGKNIELPNMASNTNPFFVIQPCNYYTGNNTVKYAGAITGVTTKGLIKNAAKEDAGSYYPNSIITYDFGLTNTQFVDILPYNGKFTFYSGPTYTDFIIPDHNLKINMVVRKHHFSCPFPTVMASWFADRNVYKRLAEKCKKEGDMVGYYINDSKNQSKKLLINGSYGLAARTRGISNPATASLTTGMGRYGLCSLIDIYNTTAKENGKKYNPLIEIDTDGLITRYKFKNEDIDLFMKQLAEHTGACIKNTIAFDVDEMSLFYSKSTKNYMYREAGSEKIKTKGSSLKSKKHGAFEIKFKDNLFAKEFLTGNMNRIELINHAKIHFNELFEVEELIIPKRNVKQINEYAPGSVEVKLAQQYFESYGVSAEKDTDLSHIVVDGEVRHLLATAENINKVKEGLYKLDYDYYVNKLETMLFKD